MNAEALLLEGLKRLGLPATDKQAGAFMAYLAELKKWNRAMSLTSLKTDGDIVVKHFLDSCLYLMALEDDTRSVADVGSGAGFPGIPMKILRPKTELYLVEPTQRKVYFLRHVIRALGLDGISVINKRAEDVKDLVVDAAVTRALFRADEFIRRAGHLVRDGGRLVLSKGPRVSEELSGLAAGYELKEMPLPFGNECRYLLIIPHRISEKG